MEGISTTVQQMLVSLFAVDSIWSVVLRGVVWLAVSIVIIVSTDTAPKTSQHSLRSNLGFFLMFLVITGGLVYMLFGYSQAPSS